MISLFLLKFCFYSIRKRSLLFHPPPLIPNHWCSPWSNLFRSLLGPSGLRSVSSVLSTEIDSFTEQTRPNFSTKSVIGRTGCSLSKYIQHRIFITRRVFKTNISTREMNRNGVSTRNISLYVRSDWLKLKCKNCDWWKLSIFNTRLVPSPCKH